MIGLIAFCGCLLPACMLLILDRVAGTSFFIPAGSWVSNDQVQPHSGGSPLPVAAPLLVLRTSRGLHRDRAGIGIISHVIVAMHAESHCSGSEVMIGCRCAIAVLSYMV